MTVGELRTALTGFPDDMPVQLCLERCEPGEKHVWVGEASSIWTHLDIDHAVQHPLLIAESLPDHLPPEQVSEALWKKRVTIPAWT